MSKKIVSIIMALMVMIIPVCANEITIESIFVYTAEDSFYVTIPETIVVGESTAVETYNINIAPNKTIYADIGGAEDWVTIYSANDPDKLLQVKFVNSEGEDINAGHPTVATFGYAESGQKEFSSYVIDTSGAVTGEYTGNVNFYIHCEDKNY